MRTVEQTIIDYVRQSGPINPATLRNVTGLVPPEVDLPGTLRRLVEAGSIQSAHDAERGTIYVRDC